MNRVVKGSGGSRPPIPYPLTPVLAKPLLIERVLSAASFVLVWIATRETPPKFAGERVPLHRGQMPLSPRSPTQGACRKIFPALNQRVASVTQHMKATRRSKHVASARRAAAHSKLSFGLIGICDVADNRQFLSVNPAVATISPVADRRPESACPHN